MRLRTSRYVRADLDTIWVSIARHNVFAADAWLDKIEARFAQLAEFPYRGRPIRKSSAMCVCWWSSVG